MLAQLDKLIQHKGYPSLSIIVPTNRLAPLRYFTRSLLKKNITKAQALLAAFPDISQRTSQEMEIELNTLVEQIDETKFGQGLGIFISPAVSQLVYFPFSVQECVILGDTFETRDLYYYREFAAPYFVLMLSKNKANLFRSNTEFSEVIDSSFPLLYTEEYEFTKPSRGTSYGGSLKSFEKDKSIGEKGRMISFFKSVDRSLSPYLKNLNLLIVCGTQDETSRFMNITNHRHLIAGTSKLQHNHVTSSQTIRKFNDMIFKFKHSQQKEILRRLDEDFGNQQVAEGLENVWKAANEGNGLLLAVEKDFKRTAYLRKDDQHLYAFPPTGEYKIMADAVDDLIETVQEKNGKVVFVENQELRKFDHIAMLLRYKVNQPVG